MYAEDSADNYQPEGATLLLGAEDQSAEVKAEADAENVTTIVSVHFMFTDDSVSTICPVNIIVSTIIAVASIRAVFFIDTVASIFSVFPISAVSRIFLICSVIIITSVCSIFTRESVNITCSVITSVSLCDGLRHEGMRELPAVSPNATETTKNLVILLNAFNTLHSLPKGVYEYIRNKT